jgi:iodotyrosine deiodinase
MEDSDRTSVLRLALGPAGPELGCDECFAQLDRYVEAELAGHDPDTVVPGLREHLAGCGACAEEHESLRALLERDRYVPEPLAWERLEAKEADRRSSEFLELMRHRRSVRTFAADPVPRGLIEDAVRVAATAPSGANQQPWTFVVVSDPALKKRLREGAEHEERLLYGERATPEFLEAVEPIGTDWTKPHVTDAPYVIVVFEQAYGLEPDGSKRKHYYVRESVGIAVGFLLAALHNAGLATLVHTPSPMGFLKDILDRPANERPFLLVAVGYPAAEAEVPRLTKKRLDEVADFR